MARPSVLTYLSPGKLIDTFKGFVDTWNYIVDFIENLRGDGDDDDEKSITVDRSVPDHPVIKCRDSGGGGTPPDDESITIHDNKIKIFGFYDAPNQTVACKRNGVITFVDESEIGGGGSAEVDNVSITKSESGYTDKLAVKGHTSAQQHQVFSKGASAPTWSFPTIQANGSSSGSERASQLRIVAGTNTNLTSTVSKSGDVLSIALTLKYV